MPLITAELRRKSTAVNSVLISSDPCFMRSDLKIRYLEMLWSLIFSFECHWFKDTSQGWQFMQSISSSWSLWYALGCYLLKMKNESCTDIQVLCVSGGTALEHSCRVGTSRHSNIYIYVYADTLPNQNHNTGYLKIRLNPDLNQAGLANSNK